MKEKLIAIILSTTLLGGGTAMLLTSKAKTSSEDIKSEIAMDKNNSNNIEGKADLNKETEKSNEKTREKEVAKVNTQSSDNTSISSVVKDNEKKNTPSKGQAQKEETKKSDDKSEKEKSNNSNQNNNDNNPQIHSGNKPSDENSNNISSSSSFMAQVESKIFEKVNAERAKAGVSKLSYNNTMQKYARIKSQDMGDRNYFDHTDPNGNLITAKMKADGVSYKAWGENIAYIGGVSDANSLANEFMTNWMNSPGHRQNILSSNFTGIGVGVYKSGDRVYATQEFYK